MNARADFPFFAVTDAPVYLDNAATTQKPACVLDALHRFYTTINSNVHRGAHRLSRAATEAHEAARGAVADFLNASSPPRHEKFFSPPAARRVLTWWRRHSLAPDGSEPEMRCWFPLMRTIPTLSLGKCSASAWEPRFSPFRSLQSCSSICLPTSVCSVSARVLWLYL